MASKVLTIALGTDSAKLSEVQLSGRKVIVFNAYDVDFTEGLCDDGNILDTENLAEELKDFIKSRGIKTKKIVYSIASKRIASKEVVIPFVKANKIGSIVKINAPEYFPISNLEDYAVSYSILEEVKAEDKKQYRLSVTATPNEMLQKYYELAEMLKMSVETIDYSGNSILQVLELQTHDETNAILQLGRENTVINIMNGKVLVMQRSVSYGLDAILSAVKDVLHMDDEDAFAFIEDNDITRICKAYPDVDEVMSIIISGIGRVFEFYGTRNAENPIAGIKFIGDGTSVNGIGEAIEANFGYPTEEILTLKGVDVKKKYVTAEQATNFMANIGAVIAPMNIQYVSKEESEKKAKEEGKLPWGLVVLAFLGAAALVGTSLTMYFTSKANRDELQRQVEALADLEGLEVQLNNAEGQYNTINSFMESTKGPSDSILKMINDLENVMPKGTTIDALSVMEGNVNVSIGGLGKKSVAKMIQGVKSLNYVGDVNIDYVSESKEGLEMYDSYTLSFTLKNAEESENGEEEQLGEQPSDIVVENNVSSEDEEVIE